MKMDLLEKTFPINYRSQMNTMGADRATGHMREEILADKGMGVIVVSSLLLMAVTAVKEEKLVNIKAVEVIHW